MSNFNIRAWYKGGVAAAVTLLGVAAVAKDPGLLIFGLGLLLLGLGEWINHPFQTKLLPPMPGFPFGAKGTGECRSNSVLGVVFGLVGLSLAGAGLYRLVWPLLTS